MEAMQAARQVEIITPLGDDVLLFHSMTATEELGRLFQFELDLLSNEPGLKFEDLLGQNVTIRLHLPDDKTRYFNGFVSRFSQEGVFEDFNAYSMTVHPWLWFLTRCSDCRIFQQKKVPDIIKEVFKDHGFTDYEESLSGSYRTWDYCVQYRETDFNFVSRLMEQEGIYYYFKHEIDKHTLVLSDSVSSHEPFPGYEKLPYYPPGEDQFRERDHIYDWNISQEIQPGICSLDEFDFTRPRANLEVKASIPREHVRAEMEIFDYPGEYIQTEEGEACALARIEELHAEFEQIQGQANARGLSVGSLFELTNHLREDQNREYLVVSATHQVESDAYWSGSAIASEQVYSCNFTALHSIQPFRAARTTPKPMVQGPQTAMVVGQEGEEIWTDKYGRVKVQFHWDRYGKHDENSSCWVRVSHPTAGKNWGSIAIPRIGQEVIVDFLEGDPDRPIITGCVYNNNTMPPYTLPDEKTKSTIKTNSSIGGEGFNEIRFEDKKEEEQLFIRAERNHDVYVKNDMFLLVENNQHANIKNDKSEHIENNRHEKVDNDVFIEIGKDQNLKIAGKQAVEITGSHSLKVNGNVIEKFQSDHCEETGSNYYLKAMGVVIESMNSMTLKVGGSNIVIDPSGITLKGPMVTIDGSMVKIASGPGSSPGSGSMLSVVPPAAPVVYTAALEQIASGENVKSAGEQEQPYQRNEESTSWIEIELVDEEDNPVPGERYQITLPDGSVARGTLDENGFARIDGIEPGTCQVTFPDFDQDAWEEA
jgi:type VI secretion system secreted protein VgrG